MATTSYVSTLIGGLKSDLKRALEAVFDYVLTNLRFGRCASGTRAENFQLYGLDGTTHGTPDTEFSIAHGLGRAPYLLIPVLPLDTVGAEIVPLRVTRAADASRIYLASSVADADIRVLVEG
jgi:hypothetical protein